MSSVMTMASMRTLSHRISLLPSSHLSPSRIPLVLFSKSLVKTSRILVPSLSFSTPKAFPTSELEVLRAVTNSDDDSLPCVRTYENDLSRLTLVGAVDFEQVLTVAAADGSDAAFEHLDSGILAMVVETISPGPSDEQGTVTTQLSTERHFLENLLCETSNNFIDWFQRPQDIVSEDSSVTIYKLSEDEIVENANSLLEQFRCAKENLKRAKTKLKSYWWTPYALSKLEKLGPEFAAWTKNIFVVEWLPATLAVTLAAGIFLLTVSTFSQFCLPNYLESIL